jgi:hypothetical protein
LVVHEGRCAGVGGGRPERVFQVFAASRGALSISQVVGLNLADFLRSMMQFGACSDDAAHKY